MYKVTLDGYVLYHAEHPYAMLTEPILELEPGYAGVFTATVPPDNPLYDRIFCRKSMVSVFRDETEIFYGEVRKIPNVDRYKNKDIYCTGALSFLADSIQPQAEYHDISPAVLLKTMLDIHNGQVEERKQIHLGQVTITDPNNSLYRYTNYENTLEAIRDKLVDRLGGYLRLRHENGKLYLDWVSIEEYGNYSTQPIEFGLNLLDYSETTSAEDVVTALIPLGATIEEEADIFQMFLDGDSCYSIAQKLNADGVLSYHRKKFNGEVICVMLRQEKYTGCTLAQKFYAENHMTHKLTKNKGELPKFFIEGTHPAIISMEVFQAVQLEFSDRYGVKIENGIAQTASYFYHRDGGAGPHPPHRKPQWSEEQRKSQSEYFRNRETAVCRYEFSHFIECENCRGHLQAQLRHYVDGSSEVAWIDPEHRDRAKDTPRPLAFRDSALKKQIADALGWETFDADVMFETLTKIGANVDIITLYFKDGHTKSFKYTPPKQIHRKRKETP